MLDKYKFVNGDPVANDKNPNAKFWWEIYGLLSGIHYSPNLPYEDCANHHVSACARNEAIDLGIIIDEITLKN